MTKGRLVGPVLALLVALTPSCLGGQTGQPSSGSCEPQELTLQETWRGATAEELVRAFAGDHVGALQWFEEQRPAREQTPVAFDDRLSITIAEMGGSAKSSCGGPLDITVRVTVRTTSSGLSDESVGILTFTDLAEPLQAQLAFEGKTLTVDASLTRTDAARAPQGWLTPQVAGAPGGSASIH